MATTKTATKAPVALDPRERSMALRDARGYSGMGPAHTVGWVCDEDGRLVSATYHVHSARGEACYTVVYLAATDEAECECEAAQHGGKACWHRGCALAGGRALAAAFTPAGRAAEERAWRIEQREEENYQALRPSL